MINKFAMFFFSMFVGHIKSTWSLVIICYPYKENSNGTVVQIMGQSIRNLCIPRPRPPRANPGHKFSGIQDLPYLKAGIWNFKAVWGGIQDIFY